ncbi:SGNH/GDSL hydrolase family protein [Mycolicibacterium cosmeticum]|uniref:Lysophospholipase L1-like esterase n=1 Tax=Mycolicibacterium cosmeticum TaxID=258533 RepID=W9AZX1_MYCCO|nr:SGNH/GDSL hydrolase family protein [Mycolicibacterium cosmeticum]TLH70595.1 SGNH/GDSL hydrolase family protein [Mycolicibacterium cosmeticum]CDO11389.1 lysophospholipase L1-like esterase [Mycolicibacterium cosmeticum]
MIRRIAVAAALLAALCACSSPKGVDSAAAADPYTCIAPRLPAAPTATRDRVAVIGDSYTGGSPQGGNGDKRWTSVAGAQLQGMGLDVVMKVGAEGGSGYVAHGRRTGEVFADKIPTTLSPGDHVVVVFGSINDSHGTPGQMAHATCDTLRDAEVAAPAAHLLVIGPPWVRNSPPPAYILRTRDILRTRSEELGATFVDPIADRWFADRPDLIGADGVHPTDAGHEYMAQKIAPVIAQLLMSPPAVH